MNGGRHRNFEQAGCSTISRAASRCAGGVIVAEAAEIAKAVAEIMSGGKYWANYEISAAVAFIQKFKIFATTTFSQ